MQLTPLFVGYIHPSAGGYGPILIFGINIVALGKQVSYAFFIMLC